MFFGLLLVAEAAAQITPSDIPNPKRWIDGCATRPTILARREACGEFPTAVVALPGDVEPMQRPRMLVVGGLGASPLAGAAVAARLPAALADLAERDPVVADTLKKVAVEIVL
ncbi:MAG: hypothetical protein RIS21_26, partial [Planctomycetota bacterium]